MSTWARPAPGSLRTALFLLLAVGIPGAIAGAVGGTAAGMAVGLSGGAALAFGSVTGARWGWALVALTGAAAAVGAAVAGDAVAAAALVLATTMLLGAANRWSVGMLTLAPVLATVFAATDRGLAWWQAGLWSVFGAACGLVLVQLLLKDLPERTALPRGHAWRHAVVLALAAAATMYLALLWDLPHGYWVTLTLLVALRPLPVERAEILQDRLWGTLLGAVVALVVVALAPAPVELALAAVFLVVMATYSVAGNYFMQTLFLTPMLLLFATAGDADASLAYTAERVLFTVVGVGLGAGLVAALAWWDALDDEETPAVSG